MATLQIRKKATKTWVHVPSDHKQYIVSKLYCKFNGDMFRVIEWGGRQRAEYHFSDITVYDDTQGGAPETFGSAVALMLRLEALEYIAFPLGSGSSGVGFQPTIVNPLNGQTLIYNSTTGIWHNGYVDVEGNRFLQIVEIPPAVGNVLTIPIGFIWVILNDTYSLLDDWVDEIPYTSSAGMMRKDIIVAIAGNNMIRIQGAESDTNPLEPTVPPNTLLVTSIDVFHDSIGEPTEPIVGDNYIPKASQGWVGYQLNPSVLQAKPTLGNIHSISFIPFTSGHIITGLNITSVVDNKIWSGAPFGIRNNSDNYPITLKHLHVGGGKILFDFPSGQDLILTKEMGVKYFKLGPIPTTGNAYAYCLNDFVSGGGPTSADQVSYGNTASGLLAETVQEAVDELSGHITQLHETKEDRVSVIPISTNTTISALHHGKILLVTADVTITFPTGLGTGFTGCAFRIATGGKMTPAFASGVTGNDFFADYNPGESLYVFKESNSTNVFYAV